MSEGDTPTTEPSSRKRKADELAEVIDGERGEEGDTKDTQSTGESAEATRTSDSAEDAAGEEAIPASDGEAVVDKGADVEEEKKQNDGGVSNVDELERNGDMILDKEESPPPSDKSTKENKTSRDEDGSSKTANPYDSLRWIVVTNDGKPDSLIKLVALKSLFAKQLPKMPRPYIARLVFDRRHTSLAILSDDPALKDCDEEVIGSICYRAFPEMRFAEIAFCAVNASHQVKGYGTKLMNLLKREGARRGIEYFITYADNYAIGYFKKQGFTKSISMPKGRYSGLIKDYDGGTMMECYVHPSIDFTRVPQMIAAQRAFLLDRIRLKANSHKVYDPLPDNFSPNLEGVSRANEAAARAMAIPGMSEAGWTLPDLLSSMGGGKDVDRAKNALKSELIQLVRKIEEQQFAWPFREPVDTTEVVDYLEVIKEPIDLSTIDKRIRQGDHYKSKRMLYRDLMLMVNNCKRYNDEASTYVQCAVSLEKYMSTLFRDMNARGS